MLLETTTTGDIAGNGQHFSRGDKASVSVRLRKNKKSTSVDGGGNNRRLSSRHSGDFSYFSAAKMELPPQNTDHEDWAYISYPNGIPAVQEIREVDGRSSANLPKRTPVKVVTREVPGISLAGLQISKHAEQKSELYGCCKDELQRQQQQREPVRNNLRRRSEQIGVHATSTTSNSSKRCSGEFQFVRTGKSGLVNEKVPEKTRNENVANPTTPLRTPTRRPNPGLGRRAATQLQFEPRKKNSFNYAMYKSQDNLVKVGLQK